MPFRYLVDTNVLLRMANRSVEQHLLCKGAVFNLLSDGCPLHFTLQNAAEFWNASTRQVERNGHGLTVLQTSLGWSDVEEAMTLLPDTAEVYATWRSLVTLHNVRGIQVHDTKLAAAMIAHSVPRILTFNTADFARFEGIEAIHPAKV